MAEVTLDHVAFGVPDVAPVAKLMAGTLGGRERGSGPGVGFRFWQWEFAGGGTIEIIVPDGPPGGFLERFLAARGAGAHHVTFKVANIRAALERARGLGYEPVGFNDAWPGWTEAFLHPKQAQGIVVQLAESHPELEPDWQPEEQARLWPFPPMPAPAQPVRVVGLRLAARSEARARSQWEVLLGGEPDASTDGLLFRWPESPLRIAVHVRPDASEGPLALEIAAGRRIALPEGPHPLLGLPLLQVSKEADS